MWTLLSAAAQRARNGDQTQLPLDVDNGQPLERPVATNGSHASPIPPRSANGGVAAALATGTLQEIRVFIHPGRLDLGVVDLDRAHAQFDLGTARAFGSLEEAEPACAGRSGFLLQLSKPGRRPSDAVPASVLFVERLRR